MNDTPRTDEEESDSWSGDAFAVSASFARTLECDINALHEEIERLKRDRDEAYERAAGVCEARCCQADDGDDQSMIAAMNNEAHACAIDIRALKAKHG